VCEPNCSGNRRDKGALRTTCIKMSNSRLSKQGQVGPHKTLDWVACGPRVGHRRFNTTKLFKKN